MKILISTMLYGHATRMFKRTFFRVVKNIRWASWSAFDYRSSHYLIRKSYVFAVGHAVLSDVGAWLFAFRLLTSAYFDKSRDRAMYYEYYASNMILLISLINQLSSRSPPPFRTLAPTNGRVSPWASSV